MQTPSFHGQERLEFCSKTAMPIEWRAFSCYNACKKAMKEVSGMGEQPKKQHISAGLLAHVGAGRGAPPE